MTLLTRKFQKLVVLVVIGIIAVTFILSTEYSKDTILSIPENTQSVKEFKHKFLYYHQLMKNYTSGFYLDDSDTSTDDDGLSELLTPAFAQGSLSKDDALKSNGKYLEKIMMKKIHEPVNMKLTKISDLRNTPDAVYQLENATFVSLVRNAELRGISKTIQQIESTFNSKYHYPYVFLNDKPFTENFKTTVQSLTDSECFFELVDSKDWDKPSHIDPEREKKGIDKLVAKGVGYSKKLSYHNMCRYYSRGFYNHPRMQNYKYYWRIEPSTNYFCDVDYDVFKFMKDNNKVYGFVLNLYDSPDSVETLWPETMEFLYENPQYLHKNHANMWLRENLQNPQNYEIANGYSTCHFWSNFEVGDMDFYRDEPYSKWVEHLEKSGGFYYERWGDAPVHSLGLALFADKSQIHWFRDIGYEHFPYSNCPNSEQCHNKCKASLSSRFGSLNDQDCLATWVKYEMTEQQRNNY